MIILSGTGTAGSVTPSDIADIWGWYEPSREIGLSNGDPFSPLTDQTGNGRHFTQATAGDRPKHDTTNGLNGHAVANFDTDGRWWDGPDMSANGQGTGSTKQGHVFIVVKGPPTVVDADNTGLWNFSSATAASHYPFTNGNIYESCIQGSRADNLPPGVSLTAWRVYEIVLIASSAPATPDGEYTIHIDGGADLLGGSGGIVGAGWPNTPTLGKNFNGQFFNGGLVAGLYLFSKKLTTDRATMIDYINDRFGLSSL